MRWYPGGWAKRKRIRIPSGQLSASETVSDLRVLIHRVSDTMLSAHAQADGDDILFCAGDGDTKLDHELIRFDSSTGELVAWVRIPSVVGGRDNFVYVYCGNAGASAQENPTGVWPNITATYHFDGDVTDVSGNANNGTNDGTTDVAGKVENCRSFDGTNDGISVTGSGFATVELLAQCAVAALIKPDSTGTGRQQIFVKGNTGLESLSLYLDAYGRAVFEFYHAGQYTYTAQGSTDLRDDAWHRVFGVRDGSSIKIYVDGVDDTLTGSGGTSTFATTEDVYIGRRFNADYYLKGDVDELFVFGYAPTAGYVLADYNSINVPATFAPWGGEVAGPLTTLASTRDILLDGLLEIQGDEDLLVDHLQGLENDEELPVDGFVETRADRVLPLDAFDGLKADKNVPLDVLAETETDEGLPLDSFVSVHGDADLPFDVLQEIVADKSIPLLVLAELGSEETGPLDGLLRVDGELQQIPVDALKGITQARSGPLSILLIIREDRTGPLEGLLRLEGDNKFSVDALENLSAEEDIPLDGLMGLEAEAELPGGAFKILTVSVTQGIPLDVLAKIREDETGAIESLAKITGDRSGPLDGMLRVSRTQELPADFMQKVIADREIAMSAFAVLASGEELAMDTFGTVAKNATILVDALRKLIASEEAPFDVTEGVTYSAVSASREIALDVLQGIKSEESLAVDVSATVSRDEALVFSALAQVAVDREIPLRVKDGAARILYKLIRTRAIGGDIMTTLRKMQDA